MHMQWAIIRKQCASVGMFLGMFRSVARCLTLRATVPLRVVRIRQPTAVTLICRQYMNQKAKYDSEYYDGVCLTIDNIHH